MRLTEFEINAIKNTAVKFFDSSSNIYIFGSRVDDSKKGGDIDIFIETDKNIDIFETKIKFLVELERKIGERKIDVIIKSIFLKYFPFIIKLLIILRKISKNKTLQHCFLQQFKRIIAFLIKFIKFRTRLEGIGQKFSCQHCNLQYT